MSNPGSMDDEGTTLLRGLVPRGVAAAVTDGDPGVAALHPEERVLVEHAREKRRREFAQGRWLAARLLSDLGAAKAPLLRSGDRAPVWPPGFVGSISHCAGVCAAGAASGSRYAGIGIDVERAAPLDAALFDRVLHETELARVLALPPEEAGRTAKLLFSIKEAAYKAAYPTLRRFVGFRECAVDLAPDGSFVARLAPSWLGEALSVPGRHGRLGDFVFAAAALERQRDSTA